jgi:6,7-dimethyl-8-ribityllumazine synthase
MYDKIRPETDATGLRIGLAVSRYHDRITDALYKAAVDRFRRAGGADADLRVVQTPGAFELTAVCRAFAADGNIDAVVALGCVISGETDHDRYIASAVATGLTMITVETGVPVAFGLLTCATLEQAEARAGGDHGNKGDEAMLAAIETARVIRSLSPAREFH